MNVVKEDEINGAEYEDKAATEWRIFTDLDRYCHANWCKFFWAEDVGRHVACDWSCNIYVKRAFWCSIVIEYRYDVGCAHHFHPDAREFLQQMSNTNTKKVRRQTSYHSFFTMRKSLGLISRLQHASFMILSRHFRWKPGVAFH
jgi:hypothetical protein